MQLGLSHQKQCTTGIRNGSLQGHEAFTLEDPGGNPLLSLNNRLSTASLQTRTAAVAESLEGLHDAGVIDGWRDELYLSLIHI